MILVRCACLLLPFWAACGLEAAATPPLPPAVMASPETLNGLGPAQLTLSVIRAGPQPQPPLSLWADPRVRASRDYVARQLSQLMHGGVPPQAAFAAGFQWLSLEVQGPSASDPDRNRARFGLLVDHALSQVLAQGVVASLPVAQSQTIQGIIGQGNSQLFAGATPPVLCIGDPLLLAHRLPQPPVPTAPSTYAILNLAMHFDFAATMSLIKKLEAAGIYYNLDTLLPHWRQQAPSLEARVEPGVHDWQGYLSLSAKGLPLHPIDPAFARLMTPGKHIEGLIGISPVAAVQLVANMLSSEDVSMLESRLGMPLNAVPDCFTGDALLEVQADSVIPLGALAVKLRPNGRNRLLISHLAAIWNGTPTPAPDPAITMWVLDTALGPVVLAYNKERLVLGDDAPLMLQLLSGQPGGATAAGVAEPHGPPVSASLQLDLPALSKQWLPLLWPLLGGAHLDLAPSPMLPISFQLPVLATALVQQEPAGAKLSALLAVPAPKLHIQQGAGQTQVGMSADLPAVLRSVLSTGAAPLDASALAQALDASFAVYVDSHQSPLQVSAVVVSLGDGFHILEEDRSVRRDGLSAAQLATHLGDYQRVMGPDPADLRPLGATEAPRLDLRWLPEPGVLSAYLQPYSAAVTVTPEGATLTEQGEPLATLACTAACLYLALFEQPRMLIYQERFATPGGAAVPVGGPAPTGAGVHKTVQF